jgi:hypothetical protein
LETFVATPKVKETVEKWFRLFARGLASLHDDTNRSIAGFFSDVDERQNAVEIGFRAHLHVHTSVGPVGHGFGRDQDARRGCGLDQAERSREERAPVLVEAVDLVQAAADIIFLMVASSPLTRSSHHAGDDFARLRAARTKHSGQ